MEASKPKDNNENSDAAGELTHFAQVTDKRMRPADEDLDDEMRDSEGIEWPDGMAWRGNYEMAPLETPNV